MSNVYTNIVPKFKVREAQLNALEIMSRALLCSYGPDGSVTAIRDKDALTKYSKDGHTILQSIKFNRPIEYTMRDDLEDITRRIVTTVGDGTTSAIILSYLIFAELVNASSKFGIPDHILVGFLQKAIKEAILIIESNKKETTIDDIYHIAMISTNGNKEVSENIADIYKNYGMDVFIDIGISNSVDTITKVYDGLTFDSGYSDPAFITDSIKKVSSIRNPSIYIFEDPIDTPEMRAFMDKIIFDNIFTPMTQKKFDQVVPTVIFCPKLSADMNATVDSLIKQLAAVPPEQRPPLSIVTNLYKLDLLNDLAILSGARMIKKYIDPKLQQMDVDAGFAATLDTVHEFAGKAELIESDNMKTKVVRPKLMFNEDGSKSNVYIELLNGLNSTLENYEATKEEITKIGLLKRRINSLKSNMIDYLVGGISMTDRDAAKDLVEDAVLNCRSAVQDGCGYGANFEGFRAFNKLEMESVKDYDEDQLEEYKKGNIFNIYGILNRAYAHLISNLYLVNCGNDEQRSMQIVMQCLIKGCPLNLRNRNFDKRVLSSIKSEQIILDAISKIIGLSFSTNQYLCQSPEFNVYIDPE